jgi:hypothetical protein
LYALRVKLRRHGWKFYVGITKGNRPLVIVSLRLSIALDCIELEQEWPESSRIRSLGVQRGSVAA